MATGSIYGVYAAALSILLMLIEHFTGLNVSPTGRLVGLLGIVGLGICIVLAMKVRKEEELGGRLTYGQAVSTGMIVAVVSGVIVGVYTYVHLLYIAPEQLDFIYQQGRERMLGLAHGDQVKADQLMKTAKFWMTPTMQMVYIFFGTPLVGLIVSLVAGIFVRTKDDETALTFGA